MKSSHIEFEQLVELSENRLTTERRASMLAHASDCGLCAKELARVHQVIGLMRADTMEDAPRDVVANAINVFRSQTTTTAAKPTLVRRVLAALAFDSAQTAPAYGLRSGAAGATRQLLYSAGDTDLDVRITSSGDATSWIISGQVLGEVACDGNIRLQGASETVQAEISELCEFTLPAVPPGSYTLRLYLTDMEIECPGLELIN